jgi:hypothetical protein
MTGARREANAGAVDTDEEVEDRGAEEGEDESEDKEDDAKSEDGETDIETDPEEDEDTDASDDDVAVVVAGASTGRGVEPVSVLTDSGMTGTEGR